MGAVWILARAEIRRRWRSAVVMTLLVGVVGAVVLATAAGARRSNTALARFNTVSRPEDVALLPSPAGYTPTTVQLRAVRHVHDVTAIAVVRFYTLVPRGAAATLGVGGMAPRSTKRSESARSTAQKATRSDLASTPLLQQRRSGGAIPTLCTPTVLRGELLLG